MLAAVLAANGTLVMIAVIAAIVGLIAVAVYSIRTLRSDEGWEERPPKQDDVDI
jgi:hypothetical protein